MLSLGAAMTRDAVRACDYGIPAVEYWPPLPRLWRPTNPPKRKRGAALVETLPVSTASRMLGERL